MGTLCVVEEAVLLEGVSDPSMWPSGRPPPLFTYHECPLPEGSVYVPQFEIGCAEATKLKTLGYPFCHHLAGRLEAGRKGDFSGRIAHELRAARLPKP
jgi:hypothetical protein